MNLGFHVDLDENCISFLEELNAKGVKVVKIHIPFEAKRKAVRDVCKYLYQNDMKAYFVLISLTQTPIQVDPMFKYLSAEREELYDRYQKVMGYLSPKGAVLGVGLIENVELAIKASGRSQYGISREQIKEIQQDLSRIIDSNFKVVLCARPDDVEAGHWNFVDFDIYDFSGEVSREWQGRILNALPQTDKPIWISNARMAGGFVTNVQQVKFLKEMKEKAKEYAYVFLYSKHLKGFEWTTALEHI
jgi:hypothetical protein